MIERNMANLYITEQGSYLRKTGKRLILEKEGKKLADIDVHRVNCVLIYGNIQFSTQAVKMLLKNGVELSLLSESGKIYGQLTPPVTKNIILRTKQFQLFNDTNFCLEQSKYILKAKLENSARTLKQFMWNRRELDLKTSINKIEKQLANVDKQNSLNSLNGIEGVAANIYFDAVKNVYRDKSVFKGRSKRPPKDPANAIMSFGYVLLASIIQSHLDAVGFDPFLGFYHQTSYGRPSLALDILEIFRAPIVDRFTARSFNLGIFKSVDFTNSDNIGFRLDKKGLNKFFENWDEYLRKINFLTLLRNQIDSIRNVCLDKISKPEYYTFKVQ